MTTSIYDFSATNIDGKTVAFSDFKGKVLLIVNTASKCGFATQYAELEELYKKYQDKGLVVMGFPCNQFRWQEPGDSQEIKKFCTLNYGVSFPMFAKIAVNGKNASPIYTYLKNQKPGIFGSKIIKWNFTKFLVNRSGEVVARYGAMTPPKSLETEIVKLL